MASRIARQIPSNTFVTNSSISRRKSPRLTETTSWNASLRLFSTTTATDDKEPKPTNNNSSPMPQPINQNNNSETFHRLAALSRPEWPLIGASVATLSVTSSILLAFPYAAGHVIDATVSGQGEPILLAGGLFGLMAASGGGVYLRTLWLARAGHRLVARLRQQTYQQLLVQENEFFHQHGQKNSDPSQNKDENDAETTDDGRTTAKRDVGDGRGLSKGDMLSRLSADAQLVQSALTTHVVSVLRGTVMTLGSTGMLLTMSPTLAALSLSTLPPVLIFARTVGRKLQRDQKQVQKALGEANHLAEQALHGMDTVKQYGAEAYEAHRYRDRVAAAHRQAVQTAHRQAQLEGVTHVAANGAVLAVLGYGGELVLQGSLTPGDLTGFVLYSFLLAGNLANLTSLYADIVRSVAASERVLDILYRTPAIPAPASIRSNEDGALVDPLHPPSQWPPVHADTATTTAVSPVTKSPQQQQPALSVSIRNLHFAYESRPQKILNGFDLEVAPGEVVALVGASGSGKSTLAKLLTRLYEVPPNTVFLNGQCIVSSSSSSIGIEALRQQIAVVSQDPIVFPGTLRENIRYGNWAASDAAVEAAAARAHVTAFARDFPDGLDTYTSSSALSGGQRQRVAIARALAKQDAALILLDEATASLDARSEHAVQQAMNELIDQQRQQQQQQQQSKTIISIAHRLSTIRQADRIVVLQHGRAVQQGTFDELAQDRDGAFYSLMKTQLVDSSSSPVVEPR